MSLRKLRVFSFVMPVYNEAEGLPRLRQELESWMAMRPHMQCEVVLVDDGSADGSLDFMRSWAMADKRIRVIALSRNYGHQAAITAGLEHASGDAVVVMDSDLQHPLSVVDRMIERYLQGYDVVYGIKQSRLGDAPVKKFMSWLFYRVQRRLLHQEMPMEANDFRLVSRECLDAINALPEKSRYVRGLFAWVGFAQTPVEYEQLERQHGETKFSFSKMLTLAWTGITSFSIMPIRFVTGLGFLSATLSLCFLFYALYQYVMGRTVAGWTTIVSLQVLMGGCILLAIGIVGEYVGKIYEEVKGRPVYIKKEDIFAGSSEKPLKKADEHAA